MGQSESASKGLGEVGSLEEVVEELVKVVSERTGLPPETAKAAAEAVLGYLKSKLPAPIASQLEGILGSGGSPGESGLPPGGLGRILGGQ